MQASQSGASQVPLRLVGTFQSHILVDGRRQAQGFTRRVVHTKPPPRFSVVNGTQGIS